MRLNSVHELQLVTYTLLVSVERAALLAYLARGARPERVHVAGDPDALRI